MRWRRRRQEDDLERELRSDLELEAAEQRAKGLSDEEARLAARRAFGNPTLVKEDLREVWGWASWERFQQDLRYALRVLRKSHGFALAAVVTLALGIGANATMFSLVDAVLLRPLPYPEASRLVHAQWLFANGGVPSVTGAEFEFWNTRNRVFDSAAAVGLFASGMNLATGSEPEHLKVLRVSRDFFRTLGVPPSLGRSFTEDEDRPGGPRAVMLAYRLWQDQFGGDPAIVGRTVSIDSEPYVVAGVMPKTFQFVLPPWAAAGSVEAWVPLQLLFDPHNQGHNFTMVARLKAGVTPEQAQGDMRRLLADLRQSLPGHVGPREGGMVLVPYQTWVTGDVRAPLLILFATVALVLLIAAVNVANLFLARAVTRQPEIAVRLALGASGGRIVRQMLTEHLLLAGVGGGLALQAAPWTAHALAAVVPSSVPLTAQPEIDVRVLAFTFLLATGAGIAAGLVPAVGASRLNFNDAIKRRDRTESGSSVHRRLRSLMVTGEVALSVLLLSGGMLLILSLMSLERVNPGFNARDVWTFHLSLPRQRFTTARQTWGLEQALLARLAALPGVDSAAAVSALPLEPGLNGDTRVTSGGHETHVYVEKRSATSDYFRVMQIPVLRGRGFEPTDTAEAAPIVVVNKTFARLCCSGREALGSHVMLREGPNGELPREIVGIVDDTREEAIADAAPAMVFVPAAQLDDVLAQQMFGNSAWVVRSPTPLRLSEVKRVVADVDPAEAVANFSPMAALVAESVAPNQFVAVLMTVFAGLALVLAAVGLYGVLAYSVAGRTREIGLRMALGARRLDVLRMVFAESLRTALVGVAIGLAGAFGLTRFLSALLFGVSPHDPLTFVSIAGVLTVVALAAGVIPARRAMAVEPMIALRSE